MYYVYECKTCRGKVIAEAPLEDLGWIHCAAPVIETRCVFEEGDRDRDAAAAARRAAE